MRTLRRVFQFHTGSIKSAILAYFHVDVSKFQFHTGSIKSGADNVLNLLEHIGFNSILVRLKAVLSWLRGGKPGGFNSILVRLKVQRNR